MARLPTSFACSCGVLECTADDEDDSDDEDKGGDASEEVREAILTMEPSDEAAAGKVNEYEVAVKVAQAGPWGTKLAEDGPSRHEVDVEMAVAGVGKSK